VHLKLVEPSPRPAPRATRRVTTLLKDILRYGERHRVLDCVVITREADGFIAMSYTGNDPLKLAGMLEVAKQDILNDI
jgi:hypothetical protein